MNSHTYKLLPLIAVCASLSLASVSQATEITESFPTLGSTLPAGWTFTAAAETPATTASVVDIGGNHYLQFARGATGTPTSAAVFYTGSVGEIVGGHLNDFSATMTVRSLHNRDGSSQGIIVGASSAVSQGFGGYYISYSVNTKTLAIYGNPTGNTPTSGTLLDSMIFPASVVANTDYRLNVSVEGNLLSASLLSLDNSVLASVSYTAASNIEGLFGFRASFGNSNVAAGFGDVTITTVIPESNSVFLIGGMLTALGAIALRKRMSGKSAR